MPSNKVFGIFIASVFFIFLIFLFFAYGKFNILILFLIFLSLIITYFRPIYLFPLNLLWYRLGIFLSMLFSPLILILIYIFVLVPLNILIRIFRIDPLKINIYKNEKSFWIKKQNQKEKIDYTLEF